MKDRDHTGARGVGRRAFLGAATVGTGAAFLPAMPAASMDVPELSPPPPLRASAETVARGERPAYRDWLTPVYGR